MSAYCERCGKRYRKFVNLPDSEHVAVWTADKRWLVTCPDCEYAGFVEPYEQGLFVARGKPAKAKFIRLAKAQCPICDCEFSQAYLIMPGGTTIARNSEFEPWQSTCCMMLDPVTD